MSSTISTCELAQFDAFHWTRASHEKEEDDVVHQGPFADPVLSRLNLAVVPNSRQAIARHLQAPKTFRFGEFQFPQHS